MTSTPSLLTPYAIGSAIYPAVAAGQSAVKGSLPSQFSGTLLFVDGREYATGAWRLRRILETQLEAVLDGLLLIGYGLGAARAVVFVGGHYPRLAEIVQKNLNARRETGQLGKNLFDQGFDFDIRALLDVMGTTDPADLATQDSGRLCEQAETVNEQKVQLLDPVDCLRMAQYWANEQTWSPEKVYSVSGAVDKPDTIALDTPASLVDLIEKTQAKDWQYCLLGGASGEVVCPEDAAATVLDKSAAQANGAVVFYPTSARPVAIAAQCVRDVLVTNRWAESEILFLEELYRMLHQLEKRSVGLSPSEFGEVGNVVIEKCAAQNPLPETLTGLERVLCQLLVGRGESN